MKNILLLVIAFVLGGCYEDKGNYNYKDMNQLVFTFAPEPNELGIYNFKQPPVDTLRVTFAPVVEQTLEEGEGNLEYLWVIPKTVNKKPVKDSVRTKELTLKFPPKKKTSYQVLFRVRDTKTGVDSYKQLTMNTVIPFIRSWFVLHGQLGDRKMGVVEGPNEESTASITLDAYEDCWGTRRFMNAVGFIYSPADGVNETSSPERLIIMEQDSCALMNSFNFLPTKRFELMMPVVQPRPQLSYGISDENGGGTLMVDRNNKFYHSRGLGFYFTAKTKPETENYTVDKIFLSAGRIVTIWDKVKKRFMYYSCFENGYPMWSTDDNIHPDDSGNRAELTAFDDKLFADGELANKEVVYLGQGNNDVTLEDGATALLKDTKTGEYTMFQISYGGGDKKGEGGDEASGFVKIKKVPLGQLNLDENSQVATTYYFTDQFFYSRGSAVYLYNAVNQEKIELYDAGAPISILKFRIGRQHDAGYGDTGMERKLGIVVNKADGTGELHEIFLDEAGDLSTSLVHSGFGPIRQICYSFIARRIL